ncbi:hypothetical protein GpartN1_g7234.t1 [Galdieria partita]|uniref:Peptidase S54 rhomboid domain-containing protein n=1 Tax=Galdieria partita TaxID=83374 RepID=A0A9C7UU13_9RHOD|nr:hypothetical protein GpartN1_g7234.t1 [Galdieria partita]
MRKSPFSSRRYQCYGKRQRHKENCFLSFTWLLNLYTFKNHYRFCPCRGRVTTSGGGVVLRTTLLQSIVGRNINNRTSSVLKTVLRGGHSSVSLLFGVSGGGNNKNNSQPGHWSHFSNDDGRQLFAEESIYLLSRKGRSRPKTKERWSWTKIILVTNMIVFMLQMATANQLLLMGAKVNELISSGQWYRLLTPIFLHGNIAHLMVNCYSLYSLGPTVERSFGSCRFIELYLFSGFLGCVASFFFSKNPSLGASGAIFGLVGGLAVYLKRHQHLLGETSRLGLFSIAQSLIFNILMSFQRGSRIDNWGHLGGFLGGVLFSYIFGPHLERKRIGSHGVYLQDRPMIKQWLSQWRKKNRQH